MADITGKHKEEPDEKKTLRIEVTPLKKAGLIVRAANHELRQQILKLLHHYGKVTVGEIYTQLRLEQSIASQHLAILRRAGFVRSERKGKHILYSVNYERLKAVQFSIDELVG